MSEFRIEEINLLEERQILEDCILEKDFVVQLYPFLKTTVLKNEIYNRVLKWILEYYDKFGKKRYSKDLILNFLTTKIKKNDDVKFSEEDFVKSIKQFNLNKKINLEFEIEKAVEYLKSLSLLDLAEKIKYKVEQKKFEEAEYLISKYCRVEKISGTGIDLLEDSQKILNSFLTEEEELFGFDGELGKLIGDFCRGDLVAFIGASGRGKTWWLIYTAVKALFAGLNVVFFSFEMTKKQVVRRFWKVLTKTLYEFEKRKINKIPIFVKDGAKYRIDSKEIQDEKKQEINEQKIKEIQKKFKRFIRYGKVKIIVCPAYSTSLRNLEEELENMEHYENFHPDVIVVDYADLTYVENTKQEYRHQLDFIWKGYRKLAQEKDCLVVTATQTTRRALKGDEIEETDIAEDIRKLTHLSKLISLNRLKLKGLEDLTITKVKVLKQREQFLSNKSVIVLSDFETGKVVMDCKHEDDVKFNQG